jgi:hypothetical protein
MNRVSTHSYGFRFGKRAHQAVRAVETASRQGYAYAVDCDLKSFFDTVNHDRLMRLLANVMLDPLDQELEKRGLRFARYADDLHPRHGETGDGSDQPGGRVKGVTRGEGQWRSRGSVARIGAAGSRRLDNGGGTALTLYSEGLGGRFGGNLGLDPGLGAGL